MKRGLDTNVLVYAHIPALPEHAAIRRYLLTHLQRAEDTLCLTPAILHEFVHVVTDPRRFDPPVAMSEAVATARLWLGRSNIACLASDESDLLRAFDLLERHRLGRKRIADTLLVATLLRHEVHALVTCNAGDFRIFEEIKIEDPLAAG